MDSLLTIGLSNALAAAVLAVPAVLVSRTGRRPALAHALWLLVLLKLVTPPLWWVPVPLPAVAESVPAIEVALSPVEPLDSLLVPEDDTAAALPFAEPARETLADVPVVQVPDAADLIAAEAAPPTVFDWRPLVLAVWLAGSLGWFGLALGRIVRFHRLVGEARPASSEIAARVGELAKHLGLSAWPCLAFVPGTVAPMLWAFGRVPRLLVPSELWNRLDADQRDALLVHELAHWRRRDHWVRWVEFTVLGLYWWHPVVWWARHELHEVEELCCDAWVVWALPDAGRAYATALVETIDFLSTSHSPAPVVASGMGHVRNLRRRMTMILRGTPPRALTWAGSLAVLGLAALLLPLAPSWAQQPPPGEREQAERAERLRAQAEEKREQAEKSRRAQEQERGAKDREGREQGPGNVQAEVQKLRQHIEEMRRNMEMAERRLQELQGRAGGRPQPSEPPGRDAPRGEGVRGSFTPPGPMGGGRFPGASGGPGAAGGGPGGNTEQRLQQIERKLEMILQQMEETRRGRAERGQPGAPEGGFRPQPPGGGDRPREVRPPQPPKGGGDRPREVRPGDPTRPDAPKPPPPPRPGEAGERRPDNRPTPKPNREGEPERRPDERRDEGAR